MRGCGVVPTLRGLLGLPSSDQDQGSDLLADKPRGPVLAVLQPDQVFSEADLRSIVAGEYRLIVGADGQMELFDLLRDPLERVDLAATLPDIASDLLRELERIDRAAPRYEPCARIPPAPSEAMLEHLRGLGYIGK